MLPEHLLCVVALCHVSFLVCLCDCARLCDERAMHTRRLRTALAVARKLRCIPVSGYIEAPMLLAKLGRCAYSPEACSSSPREHRRFYVPRNRNATQLSRNCESSTKSPSMHCS